VASASSARAARAEVDRGPSSSAARLMSAVAWDDGARALADAR
jgi:hypothetical protein